MYIMCYIRNYICFALSVGRQVVALHLAVVDIMLVVYVSAIYL